MFRDGICTRGSLWTSWSPARTAESACWKRWWRTGWRCWGLEKRTWRALCSFKRRGLFRFPPHGSEAASSDGRLPAKDYGQCEAACFNRLYRLCASLTAVLRRHLPRLPAAPQRDVVAVGSSAPFLGDETNPYRASFFNLFNYDHGCLNAHLDRGLFTLNYAVPTSPEALHSGRQDRSTLWLKSYPSSMPESCSSSSSSEGWVAADAIVGPLDALLFVGEQLSQFHPAASPGLHSVRVHPDGPHLSYSHARPDPAASPGRNRLSMAMVFVLSEDPSASSIDASSTNQSC